LRPADLRPPSSLQRSSPRGLQTVAVSICIGVVSPGAMGSGLGRAWRRGGARVVATVAGRGAGTVGLAEAAGLELLPDLDAVVAAAPIVGSRGPPDRGGGDARTLAPRGRRAAGPPLGPRPNPL